MKYTFSFILQTALLLCSFTHLHAQWVRQYPMAKLEDVLDVDVSADGYGFAAGTNDLLLRTLAGNNQWELLPGFGEGWRFEAVDYLDGSGGNVAAAGGDGLIITMDKGDHWNSITDAPAGIHSIKVFSPTHIIVAADAGVFNWENDTWTNLNVGATASLKGAFILNDQVMWAYTFSTNPTIYYTTNGGTNWSTNADIPKVDVLKFFDATHGIVLNGRNVYQSVNGGQNWTLIAPNGMPNAANDLSFGSSSNVLITATSNAKPNISIDGGLTWSAISPNLTFQRSFSVTAISDTDFWVGDDISSIIHSTDGGVTWVETSGPDRNLIQDVLFVNRQVGFATGMRGMLLRTENGGSSWEDISFGIKTYLCIHGIDVNDLWIGTSQRILHSVDMGSHWTESGVFTGNINDVLAISSTRILAASTTGYIYLSKNSGMTWDSVYNSGLQMRSLAKIDDQHYMATGYNGVIVRSDDQGQSWHSVTIPEAGLQYEQSYFLNGQGWLITSSFKKVMWHTMNSGMTWDTLNLPIDRFWDGVYFITQDTGIVIGRTSGEGRAYTTFDGGHHWQSGYTVPYPLYGVTGINNPNGTAWIYGYGSDIENLPYCNALPAISEFAGDLAPCDKDTVQYSVASHDVEMFTWHFPAGWQILGDANNDTLKVVVGSNPGNITVFASNICGVTPQITMNASPHSLPVLSTITGDQIPCEGSIAVYTANAMNVSDFVWSVPGDWTIQGNSNLPSIMVHVGAMSGPVTVMGSSVCGSVGPLNLNTDPSSLPSILSIAGDEAPCVGELVEYDATSIAVDTFHWTIPSGWTIVGDSDKTNITVIAGSSPGNILVQGSNHCGSAQKNKPITPFVTPDVHVIVNGITLSLSVQGSIYQWFLNGAPILNANNPTYDAMENGLYSASLIFPQQCTAISDTVEVIIDATHQPDIQPLDVYPVPASDELFIKGINGDFDYSIIDLLGKNIRHDHSSINIIQTSTLPEGMYLLKVQYDEKIYLTKFIISRR